MTDRDDSRKGAVAAVDEPGATTAELAHYGRILLERRRVVVAGLLAVVLLAALVSFLGTPVYRATTVLQIQRTPPEIVSFREVVGIDPSWEAYEDFYGTQHTLLRSEAVLTMAAESIDLRNHPGFTQRPKSPLRRFVGWIGSLRASDDDPEADEDDAGDAGDPAVGFIAGGLGVKPVERSHLVELSFEDRDAALAARVVNAVADAYQQYHLESRFSTTDQANAFLAKEVLRVTEEIKNLEHELQAEAKDRDVLALSESGRDISESALAELNARLVEAKARRAAAGARYEAVRSLAPEALPEIASNPVVGKLKTEHAELERQHSQMSKRFMPGWPALARLEDEMARAQERIDAEIDEASHRVIEGARASFEEARSEVDRLEGQFEDQQREVRRVNLDAVDYAGLHAEIETRRAVLAGLVARRSETETSGQLRGSGTSNILVVDRAQTPGSPVRPRKVLNLLLSIPLGLMVGCGLAFLLHQLDNTIKTDEDLARCGQGLAVLGHIPLVRPFQVVAQGEDARPQDVPPLELAKQQDRVPGFAEAFKIVRTSVQLAAAERPPRHIAVTSPEPGEGKSTVAANLAYALAQMGQKVLLIDADLRRPTLHRAMNLSNEAGLSSHLSGNASIDDVVQSTDVPNLEVVTSGPLPPNPSELLGSPALKHLLNRLVGTRSDVVILDSPPVLSVAEGVLLASQADATLLVVRAGKTTREALAAGLRRLRQARVSLVGAVLNAESESHGRYHYRYGPYAHYGDEGRAQRTGGVAHGLIERVRRSRRAKGA